MRQQLDNGGCKLDLAFYDIKLQRKGAARMKAVRGRLALAGVSTRPSAKPNAKIAMYYQVNGTN